MAGAESGKTAVTRVELKRLSLVEYVRNDPRLRDSALLKALPLNVVPVLLDRGRLHRFAPRQTVFEQGDAGGSLFWVVRGEARLTLHTGGTRADLDPIRPGDAFGEAEALEAASEARPRGRSYTAQAVTDFEVAEFSKELMVRLLARAPEVRTYLAQVHAKREGNRTELAAFVNRW